ncbi:hypothetical protein J6590_098037 [Homalodisca vitripennis]|nr:hypothetical protein J6590_098037 [Homalodisca vitripennis]
MLVFLHKLINGRIDCVELLSQLNFLVPRPGSRVQASLSPQFARTSLGAHAPVNVMMRLGNTLPQNIDLCSSTLASYVNRIRPGESTLLKANLSKSNLIHPQSISRPINIYLLWRDHHRYRVFTLGH